LTFAAGLHSWLLWHVHPFYNFQGFR
jgi:hypothetical protein